MLNFNKTEYARKLYALSRNYMHEQVPVKENLALSQLNLFLEHSLILMSMCLTWLDLQNLAQGNSCLQNLVAKNIDVQHFHVLVAIFFLIWR